MTNMDKKINELNEKLGRKTGVDFKESAKSISSEIYKNKVAFYGVTVGLGAFVFTSSGLIFSAMLGLGASYGFSKYLDYKEKK